MTNHLTRLILLFVIIVLSGCASTSLVSSWKAQSIPAKPYKTILVFGMSEERRTRQVFEEVFADELKKRGVNAIPSYTVSTLKSKPSREAFAQALKSTGASALIISNTVAVKSKKDVEAGFVITDKGTYVDNFYDYYDGYWGGIVSYETFDSKPVNIVISTVTTIKTDMFDAAAGKLVWTGSSEEMHAERLIESSKELADQVISALKKDGLI